jgi:hypothetical protein
LTAGTRCLSRILPFVVDYCPSSWINLLFMSWIVEADGWGEGPNVLSDTMLETIERALDETPLIVEHRFYRGSRAPDRRIFDGFEDLKAYLVASTAPGDSIWLWRYDRMCRGDNALATGKIPDERGRVPRGGATDMICATRSASIARMQASRRGCKSSWGTQVR